MDVNDSECCFLNLNFISESHAKGLNYVKKILSNYNETIESLTLEKLQYILSTFKTKFGTVLSYGSTKFILSIITKAKNGWDDVEQYRKFKRYLWERRNVIETVKLTKLEEDAIKNAISKALDIFIANHSNKTLYETALMVLVVMVTNFRSSELQQLKYIHLLKLLRGETISIRVKKKLKPVSCIINKNLLMKIVTTLNKHSRYTLQDLLFTRSKVTLNKTFKELCELPSTSKLGVQALRKVNTTTIIKHTSIEVAQTFNRHNDKQTTDQYYNTKSYITSYIDNIFRTI